MCNPGINDRYTKLHVVEMKHLPAYTVMLKCFKFQMFAFILHVSQATKRLHSVSLTFTLVYALWKKKQQKILSLFFYLDKSHSQRQTSACKRTQSRGNSRPHFGDGVYRPHSQHTLRFQTRSFRKASSTDWSWSGGGEWRHRSASENRKRLGVGGFKVQIHKNHRDVRYKIPHEVIVIHVSPLWF